MPELSWLPLYWLCVCHIASYQTKTELRTADTLKLKLLILLSKAKGTTF